MNTNLTFILLVSVAVVLITAIILFFFKGKFAEQNKNIYRYFPLIAVILVVGTVLISSVYYNNKFQAELKRFNELRRDSSLRLPMSSIDSIQISYLDKKRLLDSLRSIENELTTLITSIRKKEKIIGHKPVVTTEIEASIKETQAEIEMVEKFNEIIPNLDIHNIKGYTTSGNTNEFIFIPPVEPFGKMLKFGLKFRNEDRIDDISNIYLTISEIRDDDKHRYNLFSEYYKPQRGLNVFCIENYLLEKNATLEIGFFLKKDFDKEEFPRYYKITWALPKQNTD